MVFVNLTTDVVSRTTRDICRIVWAATTAGATKYLHPVVTGAGTTLQSYMANRMQNHKNASVLWVEILEFNQAFARHLGTGTVDFSLG